MRFVSAVCWVTLCGFVAIAACGGQVSEGGERGDASPGLDAEDDGPAADGSGNQGSPDGGEIGDNSCAALADCCGAFMGSAAASCSAVADGDDDQACSNQVDVYRSQGFCE